MPTVTVASLMGKASIILKDDDQTRWPTTELLGWINDGQREIVLYKPNACTKNISVPTVAGTKQTLPTDGVQLVDISRNMGASPGTTPGRAIRLTYREILDVREPDWHTKTPSAVVQHFTYNPLDPKTYYVYPPQPATGMGYVDMVYAAIPDDCVSGTGNVISVDDVYAGVLFDYVLYRAFSKESEFADPARATFHQGAYLAPLGGKAKAEASENPNTNAPARSSIQG